VLGIEMIKEIFHAYLTTPYNPKYSHRIAMIAEIDQQGR